MYIRPLAYFKSEPGELWKILKRAYGLVESNRFSKIAIEPWMIDKFTETVEHRSEKGHGNLLIAKVVDEFLLTGSPTEISNFRQDRSDSFEVVGSHEPHSLSSAAYISTSMPKNASNYQWRSTWTISFDTL